MRRLAGAVVVLLALCGLASLSVVVVLFAFNPFEQPERPRIAQTKLPDEADLVASAPAPSPESLYLDLLKRVLTRYQFASPYRHIPEDASPAGRLQRFAYQIAKQFVHSSELDVVMVAPFDAALRAKGLDWPLDAETMIGLERLDNLQFCVEDVIRKQVPGDLIECGAWRGGACIFMRAVLKVHGDTNRKVWVADSFEGLPVPDPEQDANDANLWRGGEMAVSLDDVRRNFRRYGMLDDQVLFLKGFFIDTLPTAPIEQLAVLRLDADMYESTTQALDALYPKLSIGGYVIVDDYQLAPARRAVHEYRDAHGITEEIRDIDGSGVYWRRER